jgi:hypothetical protein
MDGLGNLFSGDGGLDQIKKGISSFASKISEELPKFVKVGGEILNALIDAIAENLPTLIETGADFIVTLALGVVNAIPILIEKAPELGWLNETEFSENGWVIGELPDQNKTFYVLDAVTGEELNSTKGVVDHLVCDRYNILEDGGVQHIDVPDNSIEIFLGIVYVASSGEFSSRTFSANDFWGSAILDQSDKDTLEDFGVSILPFSEDVTYGPNGSISASNMSSFSFEVLGLYSGMRTGELVADLSNFSAEPKAGTSWNDRVCICSVNAYSQNVMTWKCRITKN